MKSIFKIAGVALISLCGACHAATWDWSFGGESGTFLTGGSGASGTYTVSDFTVTASAVGATIGSESAGAYQDGDFNTHEPYSFDWNGSAITDWHKSGSNSFDWLVYRDVATGKDYFFGWATPNVNTIDSAAYYSAPAAVAEGMLTVSLVSTVPEPANFALLALGLGAVVVASRQKPRA